MFKACSQMEDNLRKYTVHATNVERYSKKVNYLT